MFNSTDASCVDAAGVLKFWKSIDAKFSTNKKYSDNNGKDYNSVLNLLGLHVEHEERGSELMSVTLSNLNRFSKKKLLLDSAINLQ